VVLARPQFDNMCRPTDWGGGTLLGDYWSSNLEERRVQPSISKIDRTVDVHAVRLQLSEPEIKKDPD
jgi:hypothetical protein